MAYRIFYTNGPGNTIQAHKNWSADQHDPSTITFARQFEDVCRDIGAEAYIVSYHSQKAIYRDGPFTLEHRPKPFPEARGIRYHISEVWYGLSLFITAVRFRANIAILESGTSHYFVMSIFRLAGIKLIIVLHNTLWPSGFPPTKVVPRIIVKLDSLFFRWLSTATIGVSPECIRQVEQITKGIHSAVYQIRAQFCREYFRMIPAPPPHNKRPFRIMFIGRIHHTKGVFDILEIAERIETLMPGRVQWEICGAGPDLEKLKRLHDKMNLRKIVAIRGWTSLEDLQDVYARSHMSIVPTRSSFAEGLAMTAAEAILAGRPVITSPVAPALEILRPACAEARTNDIDSYVHSILELIDDSDRYYTLCKSCQSLQEQFYDRAQGFGAILKKIITDFHG